MVPINYVWLFSHFNSRSYYGIFKFLPDGYAIAREGPPGGAQEGGEEGAGWDVDDDLDLPADLVIQLLQIFKISKEMEMCSDSCLVQFNPSH